jgi:ABC-type transport system involved in multi-copper enzyme maturation permease subunit
MFRIMVLKELKAILLSPKFPATFAVCAGLMLLSVFIGVREYKAAVGQYETARQLVDQELRAQSSWIGANGEAYRRPDAMQIFVTGTNNDIGRFSRISTFQPAKLQNSPYSDDPIFAVFRSVDFAFIVQIVLSLFAILFSYDAINGEREHGTLQLTFSNPVPRVQYLAAKFVGTWLGLVGPLIIPVLLSILYVMVSGVPLETVHWLKLGVLLGVSLLFFTCIVSFGLLFSTVTRRSNVSFLVSLVTWIAAVLIIPRVGAMVAGQMIYVPSVAETEGQRDAYEKQQWEQHMADMSQRWKERNAPTEGMSKGEEEAFRDAHLAEWMEQDDAARKAMQKDIEQHGQKLNEDLRNRKAEQERAGLMLARFSPASAYQLAVMNLAGTDIGLKSRYEDAIQTFRRTFNDFTALKQKETGNSGGFRITVDSDKGFSFSAPREKGVIDVSELPQFAPPVLTFAEAVLPTVVDVGIMVLYTVLALAGAMIVFLRYDVR